jgi:hypothetical protein
MAVPRNGGEMKFARVIFGIAAVGGLLFLPSLYFERGMVGRMAPPEINHPELYYGLVGFAVLWQLLLAVIAWDPLRYRPLILIAVLEKFVYTVPAGILYLRGEASPWMVVPTLTDPVLGVLFLVAYLGLGKTGRRA